LLAEVPEAMVVWTHRDPAVALTSWCSLAAVLANASSHQVDLGALGRRWLDFWATEMDRALAARAAADPARFHDVVYEALVAEPLDEVERLYGRLGLELSGVTRRRMTRWDPPPSSPPPRPCQPTSILAGRFRAGRCRHRRAVHLLPRMDSSQRIEPPVRQHRSPATGKVAEDRAPRNAFHPPWD
jgi:hypothetical protein